MGSMITADPWLLDLGLLGERERYVARTLLRTQIVVSNRTGHIIALNDEYCRRRITQYARHGHVAQLTVRCLRCGTQARLSQWIHYAIYGREATVAAFAGVYVDRFPDLAEFMDKCPGEQCARDIELITRSSEVR